VKPNPYAVVIFFACVVGIEDETGEFKKLIIDPDEYIPTIHIYFNDDLG